MSKIEYLLEEAIGGHNFWVRGKDFEAAPGALPAYHIKTLPYPAPENQPWLSVRLYQVDVYGAYRDQALEAAEDLATRFRPSRPYISPTGLGVLDRLVTNSTPEETPLGEDNLHCFTLTVRVEARY